MIAYFFIHTGPSNQPFIVPSADGLNQNGFIFPAGQTTVRVPFVITDDEVGLEDLESYFATLTTSAAGVNVGAISQTAVEIVDDDGV